MHDLFDVTGRVAVVTGGVGQLGKEFCKALLGAGAEVVIVDLPKEDDLRVRDTIDQLGRKSVQYVRASITSRNELVNALQEIQRLHSVPPHILINNAALDSPPGSPAGENGPFESYPESSWDKVMEVNAKGVMLACQVFGGAMAQEGRGSIVNISSIYGLVSPDQDIYQYRRDRGEIFYKPVAYSASKSALFNLTRYLATYWAKKGVRVNTLTLAGVFNRQDESFLAEYCKRIPIGRMAQADEYNGAVIFLASDASKYMTGSNMVVDGGWTAW
ncbi:MAG: SDR family oxidoreductase [Candidatus Latescibacteria bacterium]|nr:SDR family oxidoreductase [Candidatus Latescibacterota bacterium]